MAELKPMRQALKALGYSEPEIEILVKRALPTPPKLPTCTMCEGSGSVGGHTMQANDLETFCPTCWGTGVMGHLDDVLTPAERRHLDREWRRFVRRKALEKVIGHG
jgi:hypothetical protein